MLESTNPKKIANEIHDRIKGSMGGGWDKQNTMDVLNGYGAFTQSTEESLVRTVSEHKVTMDKYEKAVKDAMGRKTDKERQLALDKAIKNFNVDVHSLEVQLSSHFEDAKNDIAKALGELQNHEEACL